MRLMSCTSLKRGEGVILAITGSDIPILGSSIRLHNTEVGGWANHLVDHISVSCDAPS
jgi:hypothetical protein